MINKVLSAVNQYQMLENGESVVVALSGGADSVSLLHSLKSLGFSVSAVHVNHNLRGQESDFDEEFCRNLCQKLEIPLTVVSVDVKSYAQQNKLSLEEAARVLRYKALQETAGELKIATAHTVNDSFETSLFNLVRGTGVSGIGIPPVRGNIVRPLINCTRQDVEAYLAQNGLGYVTDSTNLQENCSRNIIRLSVIPQLLRLNPSLFKTFANSQSAFYSSSEYILSQASALVESAKVTGGYQFNKGTNDALLSAAVSIILKEQGIEPSFDKITSVKQILFTGGKVNIKKGVYVLCSLGKLSFEYTCNAPAETAVNFNETVLFGSKKIKFTQISQFNISNYNKAELKYILDPLLIQGGSVVRSYLGNEKITLWGRGFSSTVKKLLADCPPQNRKQMAIIADSLGAIFVEGVGVASRVSCTEKTVSAVKISIE